MAETNGDYLVTVGASDADIAEAYSFQGLRRWMLATRDAHGLYEKFGFKSLAKPERFMELHKPNAYNLRD
jgi:hypothetical protein